MRQRETSRSYPLPATAPSPEARPAIEVFTSAKAVAVLWSATCRLDHQQVILRFGCKLSHLNKERIKMVLLLACEFASQFCRILHKQLRGAGSAAHLPLTTSSPGAGDPPEGCSRCSRWKARSASRHTEPKSCRRGC